MPNTSPTRKEDNTDASNQHRGGGVLAGITRSLVYGLKAIPGTMVKASLQKQAFVTLGRRSNIHGTTVRYRYDGKPFVLPAKVTTTQRGIEFTKGSVLGSIVFTVYDMLMLTEMDKKDAASQQEVYDAADSSVWIAGRDSPVQMHTSVRPYHHNNTNSPLFHHCLAGGISGATFSMVSDGWDVVVQRVCEHRRRDATTQPAQQQTIHTNFVLRRLLHHTLGYATLFGSYECFRRLLVDGMRSYVASGHASVPTTLQYGESCGLLLVSRRNNNGTAPEVYDMTAVPLLSSFLAGGLAGQAHSVMDHYTRIWKLQAIGIEAMGSSLSLPSLRPMMTSFLPAGACFVAFQYGADFYERMLAEDAAIRQLYPFMVSTTPCVARKKDE